MTLNNNEDADLQNHIGDDQDSYSIVHSADGQKTLWPHYMDLLLIRSCMLHICFLSMKHECNMKILLVKFSLVSLLIHANLVAPDQEEVRVRNRARHQEARSCGQLSRTSYRVAAQSGQMDSLICDNCSAFFAGIVGFGLSRSSFVCDDDFSVSFPQVY